MNFKLLIVLTFLLNNNNAVLLMGMSINKTNTRGINIGVRYNDYTCAIRVRFAQDFYEAVTGKIPLLHSELDIFDYPVVFHSGIHGILSPAKTIVTTLRKCADKKAEKKDFLALGYAVFRESVYLNEYLKKVKNYIHNIGYEIQPDGTEKFVGTRTAEDVAKIEKNINNFEQVVREWIQNKTLIGDSNLGNSITVQDIKHANIGLSKFYKHVFEVENFCAYKQFDKAIEIRDIYNSSDEKYKILSDIVNSAKTIQKKVETTNIGPLDQIIVRMKVLQETLESPKFQTKTYALTDYGKMLLKEFDINEALLTQCYGNQLDHQIHSEFVRIINNVAALHNHHKNEETSNLISNIITFSKLGTQCLRWGLSYQALIIADLCESFYEFGKIMQANALKKNSRNKKLTGALVVSAYTANYNLIRVSCCLGLEKKGMQKIEEILEKINK